ncbi:hypothetical protein FHW83_001371 [Duganella sp. SG902]|uniref:hypothetical protein n=1 Tax=Duganella sp. SG902 TaxID=2587016 RepID=UPI00159E761F|nr:hypothetical protein [Duganella sp. SG902]NVM75584.1 hypothetical protein [Duganella sp. SG902]
MKKTHRVYLELDYQMRKREDLRSKEEITLIALQEWMARHYGQPTEHGYQWKDLFLPHGTSLRISHRGMCYFAQVEGDLLIADGKIVTPSAWATEVCGSVRNAWRDIYLRRNYREAWTQASAWRAAAGERPKRPGVERRLRARRITD